MKVSSVDCFHNIYFSEYIGSVRMENMSERNVQSHGIIILILKEDQFEVDKQKLITKSLKTFLEHYQIERYPLYFLDFITDFLIAVKIILVHN